MFTLTISCIVFNAAIEFVLIYRPHHVVAEVYLLCLVQQTRLNCVVLLYSLAHFIHIRFADSSVLLCRFTHLSHDTIMITIYTIFVPRHAPPPQTRMPAFISGHQLDTSIVAGVQP